MASAAGTGEAGALAGAADALEAVECGAAAVLATAGCCAGLGRGPGGLRRPPWELWRSGRLDGGLALRARGFCAACAHFTALALVAPVPRRLLLCV
jgi:hypothetical protein